MSLFQVTLRTADVSRGFAQLKGRAPRAITRALNRSADSGKVFMARQITQDTGLPVSKVKDKILVDKATPASLVATIRVSGKRLPLILFAARGANPSRGRGRGVTADVGTGRKLYPRAFKATVGIGQHEGVFLRKGHRRLPIRELFGPSLPHVFEKFIPDGLRYAGEVLAKNLAHEYAYAASSGA